MVFNQPPSKRLTRSSKTQAIPRTGRRERPPIEYIEITSEHQDSRDDVTVAEPNLLLSQIENRDWNAIASHIMTSRGKEEASQQLSSSDCAMHELCRCGVAFKEPNNSTEMISENKSRRSSFSSSGITEPEFDEFNPETGHCESRNELDSAEKDHFPPKCVFNAVLQAFPEAVKTIGAAGCLPLHHAVRHRYPAELLMILIRAYPQALDMRDGGMRTPRDYISITVDIFARSAFTRPTSCWLQHLHDEEMQRRMDEELASLESEVEGLLKEVELSREEETALETCLRQIENELEAFGNLEQMREFYRRGQDIQSSLESEIDILRGRMEGLVGQMITKYADEEKERTYMNSFCDDVFKIYDVVNDEMIELREDLEKIKCTLNVPVQQFEKGRSIKHPCRD